MGVTVLVLVYNAQTFYDYDYYSRERNGATVSSLCSDNLRKPCFLLSMVLFLH